MVEPLNHIHQDTKSARLIAVCKCTFTLAAYELETRTRLRKSPNWGMGPNFDVSAPPTFVEESVFVLRVFVLLIMESYCILNSYLSIINKINTHKTNTDSSTTTRLQV